MKRLILLLALFLPLAAHAQVRQGSAVTPGDCTEWKENNLVIDAGAACGSGGGGSGLWSPAISSTPTSSGTGFTTWANQGSSATVTDTSVGISLVDTTSAGADNMRVRYKTAPSTPYTAVALLMGTIPATTNAGWEFGWRDSGTGKMESFDIGWNSGSVPIFGISIGDWNSPTSFNASPASITSATYPALIWVKLNDNGTTVTVSYSFDGGSFMQLYSVAKSSGFLGSSGYNQIFFACNPWGPASVTLLSYTD